LSESEGIWGVVWWENFLKGGFLDEVGWFEVIEGVIGWDKDLSFEY
jgi:hypothetical protein